VLRIPLLQGRSFSEQDSSAATPVAIVNQAFLRRYFSRRQGIGQQILLGRELGPQFADNPREIVGVASDTRELGLNEPVSPAVFIPLAQVPDSMIAFLNRLMPMNWLIRVSSEPLAFTKTIHQELLAVDPDLVTSNPRSLAQVLGISLAQQRTETALLGFFSSAALLLGASGLYGVLAYSVAQRNQEIGIRMALGANRAQIFRLVIAQGLKLTLIGILVGVAIGLALTRFMSSLLFGIGGADPLVVASVAFILSLVALAACLIPARRAARVDPMVALRCE
jgi:predicted permease